jgi:exopolysaccharide biosynthesis protein
MRRSRDKMMTVLLPVLLVVPIAIHSFPYFQRPARVPAQQLLHPGMQYERVVWQQPRPIMLHVTAIDLAQPNLGVLVTPGVAAKDQHEITAMMTSEFLQKNKLQFAVNASFFYPFQEDSPWAYYPKSGDRVSVVGEAISQGKVYSQADPGSKWSVICFSAQNQVQILSQASCPQGTEQGVSGNEVIMLDGKPLPEALAADGDKAYPRMVLAHDRSGKKLWVIAVDGKQPGYSEGVKIRELVPFLQKLGVDRAINLDGGGSTTMVTATAQGPKFLNAPIQNKIPMNERPVANHIGFFIR